ncbi:MAG TPA: methionine aminotransferase [Edaphocola sp.]|nr:methionine aminotransferase [Edaphocola sp.]
MIALPKKHNSADITIFSVMSALAQEYGAVNLSQGFPDYPLDDRMQLLLEEATRLGFNQYAPMTGLPLLQDQIVLQKNSQLKINIQPNQVTITPGATYAIFTALATILNSGDEVIILEPAYDCYLPTIEMNGGVPITIPLNYPDFKVDWERLKGAISSKTKAIIVNTPHNPTGTIWTQQDWDTLSEILIDKDVFVISDEVYDQILFDGQKHYSVLQQESLKEKAIAVYSFGKQFHATGWKIGYMIASEKITQAIRKVHQFLAFSVNTPGQYAIGKFMEQFPNEDTCSMLENKRNLLLELLKDTPFKITNPAAGSYFQIADYNSWQNIPDLEFAKWLTQEIGVAIIPLSAFYKNATDHHLVRFCFAKKDETLKAAIEKIKSKMNT